ncbi:uncharacterized protein LOC125177588 [Hyalella azteca]|uniref:Uncharacterized protein LOC125177588 n=1 Tax=Hyalella azteca TaxID=294128 RepID=A0A979FF57_HYAAZ|nr:uncharacterized protein LOC125177588 [Hyalella azteca]
MCLSLQGFSTRKYYKLFLVMNNHIVLLSTLYLIIVGFVLPYLLRERIFSMFFELNDLENELLEDTKFHHRQKHSMAYLQALEPGKTLPLYDARLRSGNISHLIIALVRDPDHRRGSQYLTQLAVGLHEASVDDNHTGIFFCNGTSEENPYLTKVAQHFPVYDVPKSNSEDKLSFSSKRENKLKTAFLECVRLGLNQTNSAPLLVTVFNDNVLPLPHFSQDIKKIVRHKLSHRMSCGELIPRSDQWLFLHLQEPVGLRSYRYDTESLRELLLISLTGAVVFHVIFKVLDPHLSSRSVLFTFIYGGSLFLTFALCMGRPYTTELRRVTPALYRTYDPPEALHFSALTLPSSSFGMIEPLLRTIKCSQYVGFHRVLDSLINSLEIPGYVVSPSLVQYV